MVHLPKNYQTPTSVFISRDHFDLVITYSARCTYIKMQVHGEVITTRDIPKILPLLRTLCPRVLGTKCFNENNFSFGREVKNTEIGHLFEHLMLEYICQNKEKKGVAGATHRGETWWNWKKESRGIFHIEIDAGWVDRVYFEQALSPAIHVICELLASGVVRTKSGGSYI